MRYFFILLLMFVIQSLMFSQIVDGQFVVVTNNGTTYSVKIQIKLQSGSSALDNATIRFTFKDNVQGVSFPPSPTEGVNYVFHNFQGGDYNSTVSRPGSNLVSINIARTSGSGAIVGTSFIDVATIIFTVNDTEGSSDLVWTTRELFTPGNSTAWTLGTWPNENTFPLPVELSSFSASNAKNGVNLKWQTKTETNNYGFEVERKIGNKTLSSANWEKIGFINGHGNSNAPIDYSYVDKNPFISSKVFYRLKQIDTDGKFEYSKEVEVELIPNEFSLFQNYPNPFNPETTIKFALPKTAKVSLIVYNLVGEKVATLLDENKDAGYYDIQFNSDNLSSGVYIYRLTAENFVQTKKMTLIR